MKKLKNINFLLALFLASLAAFIFLLIRKFQLSYAGIGIGFFESLPNIINDIKYSFFAVEWSTHKLIISFDVISIIAVFLISYLIFYFLIYFIDNYRAFSQRKLIERAFLHYVSPSVVQEILDRPENLTLGGKSAYLTVCFIDIVNFSEVVNEYHPRLLVQYLNEYFSEVSQVILDNRGTIDKYEGDAVMAFWGAPKPQDEHAELACRSALLIRKMLAKLRTVWKRMGRPEIHAKVGIVSGNMVVGNIGSNRHFNYTAIGRSVNECAKIEKLNREFGTEILVSEETYHKTKHDFEYREIDEVIIKGNSSPTRLFELLSSKGELADNKSDLVNNYHDALDAFRKGKIEQASKAIKACLRIFPDDKASQLLSRKIKRMETKKS